MFSGYSQLFDRTYNVWMVNVSLWDGGDMEFVLDEFRIGLGDRNFNKGNLWVSSSKTIERRCNR